MTAIEIMDRALEVEEKLPRAAIGFYEHAVSLLAKSLLALDPRTEGADAQKAAITRTLGNVHITLARLHAKIESPDDKIRDHLVRALTYCPPPVRQPQQGERDVEDESHRSE